MSNGLQPLKGSISNLNWFDAQRKHYETPDQIARRFHLVEDAGMRSFSKNAVHLRPGGVLEVKRAFPCSPIDAWPVLTNASLPDYWLEVKSGEITLASVIELKDGSFWDGGIANLEKDRRFTVDRFYGGSWQVELVELPDNAAARRDLPDGIETACELVITDQLGDQNVLPTDVSDTESSEEHLIQPGGPGTHWVSLCVLWHYRASKLQRKLFELNDYLWPNEAKVNLDHEPLVQCYAKLLSAHFSS